ncbi:MAG TPA: peptide MFS transporter [Verrucomicrobiae bacterium]|jgi:POT family proton-dependent oligopeptide transporter|nr:peptide MFS transporter [Verrucomicrobiae bacterium]
MNTNAMDKVAPTTTQLPAGSHPRGLRTLFFTEMWERFSYYGMRALLVLFMVDSVRGGMGLTDKVATAIYGIYTATVYLMALPGGWLADRITGAQRAVWYGGIIIALGHFALAIPSTQTFYLGLVLVVIGSGILKPNMSTMVGDLYPEGGARRDAGFTIFYMGVNLGAAIGPMICSTLGEKWNWHYGFGAAGVGMVLGLVQFRLSRHKLGEAGLHRGNERRLNTAERAVVPGAICALLVVLGLTMTGILTLEPVAIAHVMTAVILSIAALYFIGVFLFCGLTTVEKERVAVILVLFLSSALFWSGFEQAGSSFNLFAERFTARYISSLHYEVPAGWFQMIGPVFIITCAPVFAWLWVQLAKKNLDPSIPVKFAFGLLLLAAGFLVMAGAAAVVAAGHKALPVWLITTYLVHTFGELCLSPVGLSSVTKLAPRKLVGQMMGIWFLASSLGNLLAGLVAGEFKSDSTQAWPGMYLKITILPTIAGLLLIVFARPVKRWIGGIK